MMFRLTTVPGPPLSQSPPPLPFSASTKLSCTRLPTIWGEEPASTEKIPPPAPCDDGVAVTDEDSAPQPVRQSPRKDVADDRVVGDGGVAENVHTPTGHRVGDHAHLAAAAGDGEPIDGEILLRASRATRPENHRAPAEAGRVDFRDSRSGPEHADVRIDEDSLQVNAGSHAYFGGGRAGGDDEVVRLVDRPLDRG